MASSVITIGSVETDLRITLLSLRRLVLATGKTVEAIGKELEQGTLEESELLDRLITFIWAFTAHNKDLRPLSEDDIAAMIEVHQMTPVRDAVREVIHDSSGGPR